MEQESSLDSSSDSSDSNSSVVEAISERNQTWLQQHHPVYRDAAMFNASEVENWSASREMACKIQKWNVNSPKVHPILV